MTYSLTWLPTVLINAGLKVAEVDGWANRGRSDAGVIKGVMCHHTAGPKTGNMPSLKTVTNGRPDLSGPLAQLCLGRDGTFYVVAAGRANHAGAGKWQGLTGGNTNFIGIEAENTGKADDPWPDVQMDAYRRGVAAILTHIGQDATMCCGHKEYALPHGRKPDPKFDMEEFRSDVAAIIDGTAPPPKPIPRTDVLSGRSTIRRGDRGSSVKELQRKMGFIGDAVDAHFGPLTETAVRNFQRDHGLVPDGIVGPKTWAALDSG
jgi:N-acetyl-anhydromuramyl-L-alanine amidase AmpD